MKLKIRDINNMPLLMKAIREYNRKLIRVGIFDPFNAYKAYVAEFGNQENPVGPVPARPFMRRTSDKLEKESYFIDDLLSLSVQESLEKIAQIIADSMREEIDNASSWAEPLREYTRRKKGHDRILIDTLEMYNSIEGIVI